MATTKVTFIPAGPAAWARLATRPEIRAALAAEAQRGKAVAETLSPRESGRYSESFEVRADTVIAYGSTRAAAVLVNTVPYAAAVELRHHVLARTRDWLSVR